MIAGIFILESRIILSLPSLIITGCWYLDNGSLTEMQLNILTCWQDLFAIRVYEQVCLLIQNEKGTVCKMHSHPDFVDEKLSWSLLKSHLSTGLPDEFKQVTYGR